MKLVLNISSYTVVSAVLLMFFFVVCLMCRSSLGKKYEQIMIQLQDKTNQEREKRTNNEKHEPAVTHISG